MVHPPAKAQEHLLFSGERLIEVQQLGHVLITGS
jgi:hypothetical protein